MRTSKSVFSLIGASNHSVRERAEFDLYCTHPAATQALLQLENFNGAKIWEPCDGLGHISNVLLKNGYNVRCSDIQRRGRNIEQLDFLEYKESWEGDIITNPPYKHALAMVRKSLEVINEGNKVAMWLRILFLESKVRKALFEQFPPRRIWISSSRIPCSMRDGHFGNSAQGYAWFVWEKGYKGDTIIKWF